MAENSYLSSKPHQKKNPVNQRMIRNFDTHFREGMPVSLFVKQMDKQSPAFLKEYLEQEFRHTFRSDMAFQTWMFGQEKLNGLANRCFDLALSELFATVLKGDQKQPVGQKFLFDTGKAFYLQQLWELWCESWHKKQPEDGSNADMRADANFDCHIKSAALTGLAQMEKACRDVFIWQYVDGFTPQQIGTITGKPQAAVKDALCHCFLEVERVCRQTLALPQENLTRPDYELLSACFSNGLAHEQEIRFAEHAGKQKALQYYFQFFLGLNYERVPEELVQGAIRQFESDALTADEFLSLVKRALEGRDG